MRPGKTIGMVLAGVTIVALSVSAVPALAGVRPAGSTGAALIVPPSTATSSSWTTFDQNSLRTGVDASGSSFSPATPVWSSPELDGHLYGQPLLFAGRVFAATENDTVYALAADTGARLWSKHLATPVKATRLPCGDISPTVGITSTPVIDPARGEIFVVADEAAPSPKIASHHLIGLDLYTGAVLLNEVIDPAGTHPAAQLQRASLALDRGSVIAGFGGNSGDCGSYHGLVVSAPESGTRPTTYVVASRSGDNQGAVWMGGAAPTIDAQGNIWVATGNSSSHAKTDPYDESDGVLKLSPSLKLLDYFAPSAWYHDNANDYDLGSTAPALLPNGLVFVVGKSFTAYVLRQSHLGHVGGQIGSTSNFCAGDPDGGSADLHGTLFVPCKNGITAVTPTAAPPVGKWTSPSSADNSPIVAGGLVWSIANGSDGGNIGELYALNPATGAVEQQFDFCCSASSFPSPAAADGLLLVPAGFHVHALDGPAGLPGPPSPAPAISGFSPSSGPPGTALTIRGSSLEGASKVQFNGKTAVVIADSPTTVTTKVPTGAKTGTITVAAAGGPATSSARFVVTA